MSRMPKIEEGEDGWSDWIQPVMTGYKMGCCDCGLVHNMEFVAVRASAKNPDGTFEYEELDTTEFRVTFRAQRNKRSTAQLRRHRKDHP